MNFQVLQNSRAAPNTGKEAVCLIPVQWNDYGYKNLYDVRYSDGNGTRKAIGQVKIANKGMDSGQGSFSLHPLEKFTRLSDQFFSIGQDAQYYSGMMELGKEKLTKILESLNDIALNKRLYKRVANEDVTRKSLLRFLNEKTVEDQFRRIIKGGKKFKKYSFEYHSPAFEDRHQRAIKLDFTVTPESAPPTNIHAVIGRNDEGKTYLFNSMIRSLTSPVESKKKNGYFKSDSHAANNVTSIFGNLVSVKFNAFDQCLWLKDSDDSTNFHENIGLVEKDKNCGSKICLKSQNDLATEFFHSAKFCMAGPKKLWKEILRSLCEYSPTLDGEIEYLFEIIKNKSPDKVKDFFKSLGSGHKISLLTLTRLVEKVQERSLVLIDDPESHLHPVLLAAFMKTLSKLLRETNGVAILFTHSPVVLREIPAGCVWKILRSGDIMDAIRLDTETYAENVGSLTYNVFNLNTIHSGFYSLLIEAEKKGEDFNSVMRKFKNQIGFEGVAHLANMLPPKFSGK